MRLLFTKENMWTAAGFARESFVTDRAGFEAVAADDFGDDFLTDFDAARKKIKAAVGAALRVSAGSQVTDRLYANLEKVKPLLDLVDIRLGLVDPKALTIKVKDFGLKSLRDRINAHDAEGVSSRLTKLEQALTDNQTPLAAKGYKAQELIDLKKLHGLIDDDNLLQNTSENTSTGATQVEDSAYKALDALLGKLLRTGRLLFKTNKQKRRQYEVTALTKRVAAGEKPKEVPGA